MKTQIWMKNHLPNNDKANKNKSYFKNRLFINLTRATKGTYIYCEDIALSEWIKNKLIIKKWF